MTQQYEPSNVTKGKRFKVIDERQFHDSELHEVEVVQPPREKPSLRVHGPANNEDTTTSDLPSMGWFVSVKEVVNGMTRGKPFDVPVCRLQANE